MEHIGLCCVIFLLGSRFSWSFGWWLRVENPHGGMSIVCSATGNLRTKWALTFVASYFQSCLKYVDQCLFVASCCIPLRYAQISYSCWWSVSSSCLQISRHSNGHRSGEDTSQLASSAAPLFNDWFYFKLFWFESSVIGHPLLNLFVGSKPTSISKICC